MDAAKLAKILYDHKKWLFDDDGRRAVLIDENLTNVNLTGAILAGAILDRTNLTGANLTNANLYRTNLTGANLTKANLYEANLTGAIGIISPIDYMAEHFEKNTDGYIVYKTFNTQYRAPDYWEIRPNAVISETANHDRCTTCGNGINVAPLQWVQKNNSPIADIWKLLIRWQWLPGVVVPYNTDGKIRCERAELIEIINE